MESIDYTVYVIFSLVVIAWCVLHSAMISISVTEYLKKRLGPVYRFYRLFFNLTAILTLIPVALFAYSIQTQVIFQWNGYFRVGQVILLGIAVLLFFLGGRHYDAGQFLGTKQISQGTSNKAMSETGELDTSGVRGITRHPWYLAAILFIWARQLDISAILANVILTSYLIVGTCLEEKKLIREFGGKYLAYQKRVSMLIPYKWLKSKLINSNTPPDHADSADS
ncbi:MAG: isoprenylcysteine carboxylmethyltransferase family protein [Desulfobacterales bacterium]|jgi:protein-S-isoprenylcysteine O-methyltransferase Ste14